MDLPDTRQVGVIDAFVAFRPSELGLGARRPSALRRDTAESPISYLFKDEDSPEYQDREASAQDLGSWLADRHTAGIAHALTAIDMAAHDSTFEALDARRSEVSVAVRVDPHQGMTALRRLHSLVERFPVIKSVSLTPFQCWPLIHANSKEFYPVYAACVSLDLAAYINVGFPGPRVPAWVQDPIHLDEVCWFFEDLRVVMRHGGEPWADVCVKMLLRWENLYYATSAFAPKYYPPAIVDYLRSRGAGKILFAGYWPHLTHERVFSELSALNLDAPTWERFLRDNAKQAFRIEPDVQVDGTAS